MRPISRAFTVNDYQMFVANQALFRRVEAAVSRAANTPVLHERMSLVLRQRVVAEIEAALREAESR